MVSAALIKKSVSAKAYDRAILEGRLAISKPLLLEFADVLMREKFDKYFTSLEERLDPIKFLESNALHVEPSEKIMASVDQDDNIVLELAVAAHATAIVSGDPHLLDLNPFRGIPIVTASRFLKMF